MLPACPAPDEPTRKSILAKKQGRAGGEDETPLQPGDESKLQQEASRELLALGLDIFLLRNSLGEAGQRPADAPREEEVLAQLGERAHEVSRLRAQSLQDLYLKTQILLNVMEGRGHEICQVLVRSIRDDAGFLLRKLAAKGA
jgi:hypothetical protein